MAPRRLLLTQSSALQDERLRLENLALRAQVKQLVPRAMRSAAPEPPTPAEPEPQESMDMVSGQLFCPVELATVGSPTLQCLLYSCKH